LSVSPSTTDSVEKVERSHRLKFCISAPYDEVAFSFSTNRPSAPATVSARHDAEHTLRGGAESSRKVARLTVDPLGILQHPEQESRFAQQTVLLFAIHTNVTLGDVSYRRRVMQGLEQGVGVRVENVRLETAVLRSVVEAKIKVFDPEFRVLDLDFAVELGHPFGDLVSAFGKVRKGKRTSSSSSPETDGLALRSFSLRNLGALSRRVVYPLPVAYFPAPGRAATTYRFPRSSFGVVAYPTKSTIFIVLRTEFGIGSGGLKNGEVTGA
jgi:hypothetical protein